MTQFIKKYKWFLISIFIPCLIVISLSVIKVKKDVTVPSTVNSIENIITINGESKLNGSINVVSVYSYEKVSLLSYLFASCNRYAQIDDNIEYTNIDSKKYQIGGIIQKECSINNSIISGYKQAGYNIKFKFVGYYVDSGTTYLDKNLDIGDMIISVNGEKLSSDYTPGHAIQKAKAKTATMETIIQVIEPHQQLLLQLKKWKIVKVKKYIHMVLVPKNMLCQKMMKVTLNLKYYGTMLIVLAQVVVYFNRFMFMKN